MLKIPNTTNNDKLKFLYRAVELLRLEHNERGKDFRDGKMSYQDWNSYVKSSFEPRNKKLFSEINKIKEAEDMTRVYGYDEKMLPINPKIFLSRQLAREGKAETGWDRDIKLGEI